MRAQAAYRADLEQKLLADAEVQRLAQQSAADLAADLDQLMPGWRTHREQSLDFVDGVKQGGVLLADVVSPDAWDLLGPSAKAAKLAGIFAGVGKISGKVSADLVESAAKLNNLLAGKTPSSAELAPFTKAAERQLAEEIKLANQTLAKKPVAASEGSKGPGVVSEIPQITLNRQNGAAFERQVVEAFGHVGGLKNTTPVTVQLPNGAQVTTIPDLWGKA